MKISKYDVFSRRINLRATIKHSTATRNYSENVFVRIEADGQSGWGECIPREYVTGETTEQTIEILRALTLKEDFPSFESVVESLRQLNGLGSAKCALELAMLDAACKVFGKPLSEAIGPVMRKTVIYTAIIATDSLWRTRLLCYSIRHYGINKVKVKVGFNNDSKKISLVRKLLGKQADIRVDANGSWDEKQAVHMINELNNYNISYYEQPVQKDNLNALARIRKKTGARIIADESLVTLEDARKLAKAKACDMFNLRLSKCGGILNSFEIYEFAKEKGIECMLGCMVGETGILSAAGRHFAQCLPELKYVEGSYDRFLLKGRYTRPIITFGKEGRGEEIIGTGLGIQVATNALQPN